MRSIPKEMIQEDPKENAYDASCKRILSYKSILAWILKDALEECKDLSISEIMAGIEPDNSHDKIIGFNVEDESIPGARLYFDLVFVVRYQKQTILVNIEAQSSPVHYHLKNRALYYGCRLIDLQKNHALGFQGSDYDALVAVATIWLRNEDPKDASEGIVSVGIMDLLRILFIHPSQDLQGQRAGAQELLSLLFVSQEPYETKRQVLKERYGILMTEGFEKEMRNMCTFSEGLWNRALNTGMEQGMEQGIEQGLYKLMKNQKGLTLEQAMDLLEVPQDLRESIRKDPRFLKRS